MYQQKTEIRNHGGSTSLNYAQSCDMNSMIHKKDENSGASILNASHAQDEEHKVSDHNELGVISADQTGTIGKAGAIAGKALSHGSSTDPKGKALNTKSIAIKAGAAAAKAGAKFLANINAPIGNIKTTVGPVNGAFGQSGVFRIPPRVDTDVTVKVSGVPADHAGVFFKVNQSTGDSDGTVTINGKTGVFIKSDQTLKLRGVKQTSPGNDKNLCLAGVLSGKTLTASNHFSVAAYPKELNYQYRGALKRFVDDHNNLDFGSEYLMLPVSDSLQNDPDLDKTKISEIVKYQPSTGMFGGGNSTNYNSLFLSSLMTQSDKHTVGNPITGSQQDAVDHLKLVVDHFGYSTQTAWQYFVFGCERTKVGLGDVNAAPKIPKSGFKITKNVYKGFDGKYCIDVKKESFANNGVTAGSIDDSSVKTTEIV